MLNKWQSMKEDHDNAGKGGTDRSGRRPYLSSLCTNLSDAEFWRKQIVNEISRGVSDIQNTGMLEHQVRDLNDKINKGLREKYHWNKRVKELGGADYNKLERSAAAAAAEEEGESAALGGSGGYKYFGAARELPGVKELFMKKASSIMKRTRGDVYKDIGTAYYGFVDEEDGVLLELESKKEEELEAEIKEKRVKLIGSDDDAAWQTKDLKSGAEDEEGGESGGIFGGLVMNVPLPSQELIDQALLDAKKKSLMMMMA